MERAICCLERPPDTIDPEYFGESQLQGASQLARMRRENNTTR
jgi:hypothetical protein